MKFLSRMVLAVAFAVAGVSLASAQGRPGGGFGGGFGAVQSAYSMVATNKVLQEELKVSDEQKTKLEEAMKPIAVKRTELFGGGQRAGGGGGQRPMPTPEQLKEMGEKMAKLTEETKKAVEGVLEAKQTKRLSEIDYQLKGFAAFTDKTVQEKLKLDDAQKDKLKGINEEYTKDRTELAKDRPRGGRPGAQQSDEDKAKMAEFTKKSDALRKEAEDKAAGILTADQKTAWKDLVGEKVDTTKLLAGNVRPMRRDN